MAYKFFTATGEIYRLMLHRLCPPGSIWLKNEDPDRRWAKLLYGLGDEMSRAHNRANDLIVEMDPRTTTELIDAWERVAGLPDPLAPAPTVLADRRLALHARVTAYGGQAVAYFIAVAANIGVTITITEPGLTVDIAWAHWWWIHAPSVVTRFRVGVGRVGDPLIAVSALGLRMYALMQRIKPEHTITMLLD